MASTRARTSSQSSAEPMSKANEVTNSRRQSLSMITFRISVVRCHGSNRAFLSLCIHRAPKAQASTIVEAYGTISAYTRHRPGLVIRFLSFHIRSPSRAVSGIRRIAMSNLVSQCSTLRHRWVRTLERGLRRGYASANSYSVKARKHHQVMVGTLSAVSYRQAPRNRSPDAEAAGDPFEGWMMLRKHTVYLSGARNHRSALDWPFSEITRLVQSVVVFMV